MVFLYRGEFIGKVRVEGRTYDHERSWKYSGLSACDLFKKAIDTRCNAIKSSMISQATFCVTTFADMVFGPGVVTVEMSQEITAWFTPEEASAAVLCVCLLPCELRLAHTLCVHSAHVSSAHAIHALRVSSVHAARALQSMLALRMPLMRRMYVLGML